LGAYNCSSHSAHTLSPCSHHLCFSYYPPAFARHPPARLKGPIAPATHGPGCPTPGAQMPIWANSPAHRKTFSGAPAQRRAYAARARRPHGAARKTSDIQFCRPRYREKGPCILSDSTYTAVCIPLSGHGRGAAAAPPFRHPGTRSGAENVETAQIIIHDHTPVAPLTASWFNSLFHAGCSADRRPHPARSGDLFKHGLARQSRHPEIHGRQPLANGLSISYTYPCVRRRSS
jgi:hypothetical protein